MSWPLPAINTTVLDYPAGVFFFFGSIALHCPPNNQTWCTSALMVACLAKGVEVPPLHGLSPQLHLGDVVERHHAVAVAGRGVLVAQLLLQGHCHG